MQGTVAITDYRWYLQLRDTGSAEVNFWKPSARQGFNAPHFSPFFFKLPKPYYAICGFGFFAQYSALPVWLAWEAFGRGNGCDSLEELQDRIDEIRERFRYESGDIDAQIGCIQIVNPFFFTEAFWIPQPSDWPVHGQRPKRYDLESGEGKRIWDTCLAYAATIQKSTKPLKGDAQLPQPRFGNPVVVEPRLGQGTFRIAVTEAYGKACAVSREHSLPALDAAHIQPFAEGGDHEISNGLLLRADLHRLFDRGYLTITPEHKVKVSTKLWDEYHNGRTYYAFKDIAITLPSQETHCPKRELLDWHSATRFIQ